MLVVRNSCGQLLKLNMKEPPKEDEDVKKKEEKPEKKVWLLLHLRSRGSCGVVLFLEKLFGLQTAAYRSVLLGFLAQK